MVINSAIAVIGPVRWWTAQAGEDGQLGAWVAYSPDLCVNASGRSEAELEKHMQEAATLVFYDLDASDELEETCRALGLELQPADPIGAAAQDPLAPDRAGAAAIEAEIADGRPVIVPFQKITRTSPEEVAAAATA